MGKNKPLKVKAGDRLRAALKPTEHQKLVKPRQKGKLGQSPDERRAKAKLKAEKARTAAEWEAKQAADEHASLAKGLAREQGQGNKKSEEKAASSVLKRLHNGFLSAFDSLRRQWPPEMARLFSPQVSDERRAALLDLLGEQGEALRGRFSWAIPDERAIRILHHFSPVVEIGAGDGYWAGLVEAAGGDVLAFDIAAAGAAGNSAKDKQMISRKGRGELAHVKGPVVAAGGPEVLLRPECVGRALVLCYPDEYEFNDESLGNACLDTFQGDTIIHIGELFGDTISLSQAPWGRTSDPNFQVRLAREFHCILKAALPSWPISRDTISVWKRTVVAIVAYEGGGMEGSDEDEACGKWGHIPPEEQISLDAAAPCMRHLLKR